MPDLEDKKNASVETMHKAIFAAGCFWGVEKKFSEIEGVIKLKSDMRKDIHQTQAMKKYVEVIQTTLK